MPQEKKRPSVLSRLKTHIPNPFSPLHQLLPLHNHRQGHETQHDGLEPRVLAQQDGDVADKRHVADDGADDVGLAVQKRLADGVEFRVVGGVVVALCQELQG